MFCFVFLFPFSFAHCDYVINAEYGGKKYTIETDYEDKICINTSIFPTFILIDSFNDDTEYLQYFSVSNKTSYLNFNALLRFLPMYQTLSIPFSSGTIFTPTPTNLTISIVSLPGMCNNGYYFSNKRADSIRFAKVASGFESLTVYDDKCLIFTTFGNKTVSFEMNSNDEEDQLFVYYSYDNYTSISGNSSFSCLFCFRS